MKYDIFLRTKKFDFALTPLYKFDNGETINVDNIKITLEKKTIDDITTMYTLNASGEGECYFSLQGQGDGKLYSFNGECEEEHVFRQSPHDVNQYMYKIDGTAIPIVACVLDDETKIFISDNPSHVDNYTTEHIIPEQNKFYLSSGDPGGKPNFPNGLDFQPYFHNLKEKNHIFRFLEVTCKANSLKSIRRETFLAIERVWGNNSPSLYRSVCFAANYMHLRKNETKTSDIWIVPGIEYANTQYLRDAFWQTFILPPDITEQCYKAPTIEGISKAEYSLFYVIWSYRTYINHGHIEKEKLDFSYNTIMKCLKKVDDGRYCPDSNPDGSYRNWFDICCYEFDDCDSYSQGLCICALRCLKEMGYDIQDYYERAKKFYLTLFNGEYVNMSLKKPYQALDFGIGDLLHILLFNETFLPDDIVLSTYDHIMNSNAKTPYGVKITSDKNGDYLKMECYGAYGFVLPDMAKMDLGRYANGGSYHVYEMLFHIEGYLHHSKTALQNMIDRLMIDLNFDGATHEYMHTIKGNGVKANQGWNASIYAIWDEFCARGIGDKRFFDEAEEKMRELN